MTHDFQRRLPLSRHAIDRAAHRRTNPLLVGELLAEAHTRVLLLHQGRTLISHGALRSFTVDDIRAIAGHSETDFLFLGHTTVATEEEPSGTPYLALPVTTEMVTSLGVSAENWVDLRTTSTQLSDRDAGLFTQALALANWHRSHRFAPSTGASTVPAQAGWVRHAKDDEQLHIFPRTDPAVIVLVTDGSDRVLLGNNALWEPTRYSLLAGYVEPGESLESAVVREVREESGLEVVNPLYRGSQPWPFPASLMLGFTAQLAPGEDPEAHAADGEEIRHLRWFTRTEILTSSDGVVFPGPASIARALLEDWLGEPIEQSIPWTGVR